MKITAKEVGRHWASIGPLLTIRNEHEYDLSVQRMNVLLDEIGTDDEHPLYDLLDTLSTIIHAYEEKHFSLPDCSGAEMLRFLMEEHGLTQTDLPEIGSQGVVLKILNGKRELNIRQVGVLAKRFHVSRRVKKLGQTVNHLL